MTARSLVCALALICAPLAASAEVRFPGDEAPQAARPLAGGATPLFYALPGSVLDGREHQLDFVVTEKLVESLTESVAFRVAEDVWRPFIEVLPLHPQFLAELQERRPRDDVRVSIRLDDVVVDDLSLTELTTRSEDLRGLDLSIVNVRLRPSSTTLAAKVTPYACVYQCEQAELSCENYCLSNPNPLCEDRCDTRFHNCLQVCGCPVAVRELWITTTYVGYTAGPRVCLFDVDGGRPTTDGHYYDRRTEIYKNEHYVDVVQCDGTHTTVLGSVDYTYKSCVKRVTSLPGLCIPNGQVYTETICSH